MKSLKYLGLMACGVTMLFTATAYSQPEEPDPVEEPAIPGGGGDEEPMEPQAPRQGSTRQQRTQRSYRSQLQ